MKKQDCYIPHILYNNNDLSLRSKILYSELVSVALENNDENVYEPFAITLAQIAERLGISKPTAAKCLQSLINYGLLIDCGRNKGRIPMYALKETDWLKGWTANERYGI